MKIYSKHKDYFDSVAAYGVDDHVHWIRNPEAVVLRYRSDYDRAGDNVNGNDKFFDTDVYRFAPTAREESRWTNGGPYRENIWVGFCGKIYPVIRFHWRNAGYHDVNEYAYTLDDVIRIFNHYDPTGKRVEQFSAVKKIPKHQRRWQYNYCRRAEFNYASVKEYFEKCAVTDYPAPFVEHKVPIFVIRFHNAGEGQRQKSQWELTTNACLKDLHFQAIKDPYSAYQEIEQYISGILGLNDPETVHIADEYLAKQKGFDEWSFKKLPTKRR